MGSGAWTWFYKLGLDGKGNMRVADGIFAIKQELAYNGYTADGKVVLTMPSFGKYAVLAVKQFQAAHSLTVDGVVGPATARVLFRKRAFEVEDAKHIPDHLLARLLNLESNDDPVAQGVVDPNDEGIGQVNLPSHPDVSLAQAHDPAFVIPWAGSYLRGLYTATGGTDWDGALAAYNLGTSLAKQWLAAGKPTSGGPKIGTNRDGSPRYAWNTASSYVRLVRGTAW
jgi:soluble lytic murein transglycosylase-like protein